MTRPVPDAVSDAPEASDASASGQRRTVGGSTLLFGGRLLSLGTNFVTQVILVRALTSGDFGAFAYCLSVVLAAEAAIHLGLDRAVPRFVAKFDEEGRYGELFGALLVQLVTIVCLGAAVVLLAVPAGRLVGGGRPEVLGLLPILVALAPLQAADDAMAGLFAVMANAKAIFVRKYLVGPLLRLAAAAGILLAGGSVYQLGVGYVVAAFLGVLLYVGMLVSTLRSTGLAARYRRSELSFPVRTLFGFSLPLLSADLVLLLVNSVDAIAVMHYHGPDEVAALRVVGPLAAMTLVATQAFTPLFTPHLSRVLARGERDVTAWHYWETAAWVATLSFPVVAVIVSAPTFIVGTIYGDRYSDSAVLLVILALGLYLQAATGFNGLTLQVFGRWKGVVAAASIAAVLDIVLLLTLVPRHGALGAAVASSLTLVGYNVAKQVMLARGTGITLPPRRYAGVYFWLFGALAALLAANTVGYPSSWVGLVAAAGVSLFIFVAVSGRLDVVGTFPAAARIPLLKARRRARQDPSGAKPPGEHVSSEES
ncbi:oligosaccharide flippase family protein [Kineosporia sp. A_224]|uniref:oligosaccharide flippase family protein n=1 Tax=Kineosporia sp. A_224 TaxID=1962180 RepID=UPI00130472A7|nr:oligosaccharide flippase family protein [Kineosporia sp. A_224]